jgi:phosphate transport system substrate-binding protein
MGLPEKIKAIEVDGVACTTEAVTAGAYKLVRPVYLLTKGEPSGMAKAFIDYVLGAEGQKTIKNNGLLPAK